MARAASPSVRPISFASTLAVPSGISASGSGLSARPLIDFVDGAVAAGDRNEIVVGLVGVARDGFGVAARRRFAQAHGAAERLKFLQHAVELAPPPRARGRIEDHENTAGGG